VLAWMIERCAGRAAARDGGIGLLPRPEAIDTRGMSLEPETLRALLSVDSQLWRGELQEIRTYLEQFGERLPAAMRVELDKSAAALGG
jgi:phosphoenolpyruvate carboxykinase (GTP)